VLITKGVTAWRRALTHLSAPTPSPVSGAASSPARPGPQPDPVPAQMATELVHALACLAVALAGT
jgi:hypothetical protein